MSPLSQEEEEVVAEGGTTQFSKSCRQIYGNLAENTKSNRIHPTPSAATEASEHGATSPTQSAKEMRLSRETSSHLEWRSSERIVRWIMAGRAIEDECPNMFASDVVNWKLRVTGMMLYGAVQMFITICAAVFFGFAERMTPAILLLSHSGAVITGFLLLTITNRLRLLSQTTAVTYCSAFLVLLCTIGPSVHFVWGASEGGSSEDTCSILIWNLGGPAGALFLLPRPIQSLSAVMALRIVLDILVLSAGHVVHVTEHNHSSLMSFLVITISHALCPLAIAFMFRRASAENKWRSEALAVSRGELAEKQASSRWLIYCLIPEQRALKLPSSAPEKWHTGDFDLYEDCSIIQMDVSGFTALSAQIGSDELVDLINALFTSIDFAAECIGKVWKVELIGDCYKALVGGVFPCEDHSYRAAVFAYTIVEIVKRISDRLAVELRVRVGVHSGQVTAGVVGEVMPRYLIFGRDTEVVNKLECSAEPGQVLMSEACAKRLERWPHVFKKVVPLCDGTEVRAHGIQSPQINQKAMTKARAGFRRLAKFHKQFCRSRYNLKLISDPLPLAQGAPEEGVDAQGEESAGEEALRESASPSVASQPLSRASSYRRGSRRGSLSDEIGYISMVASSYSRSSRRNSRRGSLSEEIGYISKVATELENKRMKMAHQKSQGSLKQLSRQGSTRDPASCTAAKPPPSAPPRTGLVRMGSADQRLMEVAQRGSERVLLLRVQDRSRDSNPMFLTDSAPTSAKTEPPPTNRGVSGRWLVHSSPAVHEEQERAVRPVMRRAKTEGRLLVRKGMFSLSSEDALDRAATAPAPTHSLRIGRSRSIESADPPSLGSLGRQSERLPERLSLDAKLRTAHTVVGARFGGEADAPPPHSSSQAPPPAASPDAESSPSGGAHNPPLGKPPPPAAHQAHGGSPAARRRGDRSSSPLRLKALPPVLSPSPTKRGRARGEGEGGSPGDSERKKTLLDLRPLRSRPLPSPEPPSAAAVRRSAALQEDASLCQVNPPASERSEREALLASPKLLGSDPAAVALPGYVEDAHPALAAALHQEALSPIHSADSPVQHQTLPHGAGGAQAGGPQEPLALVVRRGSQLLRIDTGIAPAATAAAEADGPVAESFTRQPSVGKTAWRSMRSVEDQATRHVRIKSVAEEQVHERAHRTAMRMTEDTKRMAHKKDKQRPRRNSVESVTDTTATTFDTPPDRLGSPGSRQTSWFLPSSPEKLARIRRPSDAFSTGTGRHSVLHGPEVEDELPAINDTWLGASSHPDSEADEDDGLSDSDGEEEGGMDVSDKGLTMLKHKKGSWIKDDEDGEAKFADDGEAGRRLARITSYFLLAICCAAAMQTGVMLFVFIAQPDGREPQMYDIAPAVLYMVVLSSMIVAMVLRVDWSVWQAQLYAGLLLLLAPAAMVGGLDPAERVHNAMLWSFLAVLLRSTSTSLVNHDWLAWYVVYLGGVAAFNAWSLPQWGGDAWGGEEEGEAEGCPWWRELLLGANHVLPSSLFMLPLALTARDLLADEEEAVTYLLEVQQQERLESLLLTALVPPEVSQRFLMADRLIADKYGEATVLFIYVCGYEEVMLEHGADMTISWVNQIFTCLDHCINQFPRQSVTKVETFNNFLLAFSGELETGEESMGGKTPHAERCMALAVHMLQAAGQVERPDGRPTLLKVGLSTGAICAGVICGLASPRYSIFGDTVNTASRMASNAQPCTAKNPYIHCSAATRAALHDEFCEELQQGEGMFVCPRGDGIEIKGKGKMQTFCATLHREPVDSMWQGMQV